MNKHCLYSALTLILVVACENTETIESEYPTMAHAITEGAIERGWVPSYLPPNSKNIIEKHDLDSNQTWLKFEFQSADLGITKNSCHIVDISKMKFPLDSAGDWWPPELVTEYEIPPSAGYVYYECSDIAYMAVNSSNHQAFYWRLSQ